MSVIVAIKENDIVYMGADSQTSVGDRRVYHLNEFGFKIHRLENGILAGFCGRVRTAQTLISLKDVFTLDENGELTKKHIVREIVPKIVDNIAMAGDEAKDEVKVSILLAHKDKLYRINSDLHVINIKDYVSIGAGDEYTYYELCKSGNLSVRERMLNALIESAKCEESVSGPYVFIDTKNNEYEVIDMGGKNYWLLQLKKKIE